MKRVFIFSALCILSVVSVFAQVTTKPVFIPIGYEGEVTVIFNPNEGNGGMKTATKCYAHTGVTADGKQWQHAPGWRDGKHQMSKNADGNWELKITPNIHTYYGCKSSEVVTQLSFVFNDGPNGSLEGKDASGNDIFVDLVEPGLYVKLMSPSAGQLVEQGETLKVTGAATEEVEFTLQVNGETVKTAKGVEIEYSLVCANAGDYKIKLTAATASASKSDEVVISVFKNTVQQERPSGIVNGIYYDKSDATKVTLCTYAASKTEPAKAVFVVGDFNNWQISPDWQMKRDGNYFWLEAGNLEPQKEYAFQYVVVRSDGMVKRISDLYSTKLLHPDDKYEPKQIHPDLKDYPKAGDGYVTVIQTDKPAYNWSDATMSFRRPNKNNLVIYELWVYDYTQARSFGGLMRMLDYIENLGVNAIELMPVCEFDGNYNWGYSPNHYFAVDKAYGSEEDFKRLIDECHKRGMAVIMDMVFNHATGLNPMNKLYPYGNDLKQNPWFNVSAPHSDNVYEDWNHDFEPARDMFTHALQYWLAEYHVDGYRMDLSHGFCGSNCNNLMANIEHYYKNGVLAAGGSEKHGEPYFILEHWGSGMGTQRPKLVAGGMLCWQNTNNAYCQTAMGWLKDGDGFADANKDGYVSYCESHDEERNFYKAKEWGNGNIKTSEEYRLMRVPVNIAFNVLLNGPHMIWQYNELGYDYSINSTKGSTAISEGNRTSKKEQPEAKGWFNAGIRMQQYQKTCQIVQLRTRLAPEVFEGNPKAVNIGSGKKLRTIEWGEEGSRIVVIGNFSADELLSYTLPDGEWYDYLGNKKHDSKIVLLLPGMVYIFTQKHFELPYIPASYTLTTDVDDIPVFDKANTRKIFRDGQILVVLPDGREFTTLGVRVR